MSSSLQASPPSNPATQQSGQFTQTPSSLSPNHQQNGNPAAVHSPADSQQFHTPSADSSAMITPLEYPRTSPNHASPSTPTTAASNAGTARNRPGIHDILGGPPIPPPRTSSNNRVQTSAEGGGSSRQGKRRKDDGQRRGERERGHTTTPHHERAKDDMNSPPVKSRRKAPHSPEGPQRAASTREPRDHPPTALESRSEAAMGPSSVPTSIVKDGSAVITRMVVTDPEVDATREQQRQIQAGSDSAAGPDGGNGEKVEVDTKNNHDGNSGSRRKDTSFGDYYLGQTLGEGEFGKVRLGWKRGDGSVQVAIKLIRRESLGHNPSRLPKIHREISILSGLSHPNIVRLHEMVQTERHIGIILEYASGGELFDYILNHRHLKDNAARRLFAQLVSGVGYLHKKGIVHRDLKLENLLLDRNRNIIITDFGFANTFNPVDELNEEIEYNLTNREFVRQLRLDRPDANGMRRGDLMQTSCGSPCYAAPELVVSDSLYTGRKVDVWSCGVILYAMLAGYLPFDDDPANPDGDNINLLYKYIVTTPLTFPEFVTPHARDLLRRILVPDPRKRADLFEVARHSWLAEYADVVSHITSNTTNVSEISNTTVPSEQETPLLARSASVREPPKAYSQANTAVDSSNTQQGKPSQASEKPKHQRDAKRRTVQVEYVAPQSQTTRGDVANSGTSTSPHHVSAAPTSSHINPKTGSRDSRGLSTAEMDLSKPLPKQPIVGRDAREQTTYSNLMDHNQGMTRPKSRDIARSVSELTGAFAGTQGSLPSSTRPQTGGSVASTSVKVDNRLASHGSYSQPVAPAVATTNVQGRLAQPKISKPYNISAPMPMEQGQTAPSIGQPSTHVSTSSAIQEHPSRSHKRSSTVSSIGEKLFGRSGSIFGGRTSQPSSPRLKPGKRYPPTSMKEPFGSESRPSMDSRRSISYAFRKQSDAAQGGRPRRFSLLPASLSLKSFTSSPKDLPPTAQHGTSQLDGPHRLQEHQAQQQQQQQDRRISTAPATVSTNSTVHDHHNPVGHNTQEAGIRQGGNSFENSRDHMDSTNYSAQIDRQFATLHSSNFDGQHQSEQFMPTYQPSSQGYRESESNGQEAYNHQTENGSRPSMHTGRLIRNPALQKNNRKFTDVYEYERVPSHHSGSSGAARKVMDFFRRRGKARAGEDR